MLLFCLDCGVSAALDVLPSSLRRVGCLCLVNRLGGLGLAAEAPLVLCGEGCSRNLSLLLPHDAPGVADLLDSTCKK